LPSGWQLHSMESFTILITSLKLTSRSGTETYVRDLALELLRRRHRPIVYAPIATGAIAHELQRATVPVVERLDQVGVTPDIIHGHHAHQVMAALLRFERTPAIFVCHDYTAWHDEPPIFPRILRYVPVDHTCRDRLECQSGVPHSRVQVILNFVDLERFGPRGPLPLLPQRALVFSNLADEHGFSGEIACACERVGMAVDVVGANAGRLSEKPEEILGNYDLVFAKGKAALEALAVGTAVILCDKMGLGPLVTVERLDELRLSNFGRRQLQLPVTWQGVLTEIARYNAKDATEVSRRVRSCSGLVQRVDELLDLYQDVIAEHQTSGATDTEAERRAVAQYMERIASTETLIDSATYKRDNIELRAALERLRQEMERARRGVVADETR
jgi:Glycosyltransferase Family 4